MPRTHSLKNQAGINLGITEPVWLLELDYSTPIRITSRETVTYDSDVYTGLELIVGLTPPGASCRFFNDGLTRGGIMISEGSGVGATLSLVYGQPPFSPGDADVYFSGVTGAIEIDSTHIEITLSPNEPFTSPFQRASHPVFKHLPPPGMQIQTRSGVYIMKRND